MAQKYFINIDDLLDDSIIQENVSVDLLTVILKRSQRMHITKLLGSDLYDHLLDNADSGTYDNADEQTLVEEWLRPYLICKVEQMAALNFNVEIRNKSTGTSNDEYQTAADSDTVDKFQNDLQKQAQFYKEGLVDFIKDNSDSFPLYPTDCSEVEGAGDSHSYAFGSVINRTR